jgi:hypothetical protein
MIIWLLVIAFLATGLAIASWLVVVERRQKNAIRSVIVQLLNKGFRND